MKTTNYTQHFDSVCIFTGRKKISHNKLNDLANKGIIKVEVVQEVKERFKNEVVYRTYKFSSLNNNEIITIQKYVSDCFSRFDYVFADKII